MDTLFSNIYKNKRVFVTGHTGFKGSWLSLWLSRMGAQVCGYSLAPSTEPNHFSLLNLDIESHIDTICNYTALVEKMRAFGPDIVFHLAAQPLVRLSYENPHETYETNVMGTLNVCEASRSCSSVKALVAITTDKVYQNNEWEWGYREIDRLGGYDPYSSSKACAEILLASYQSAFLNPADYGAKHTILISSVRAGNVIGGGDWSADRLVPDIVKAASQGKPVIIRNPESTRPWQHVLDCLSGYLLVGQYLLEGKKQFGEPFNFGPSSDDVLQVRKICEIAKKFWPQVQYEFPCLQNQPHEAGALRLDCSKAHAQLGWKPLWDSTKAIETTVTWYRDFYSNRAVNSAANLAAYIHEAGDKGIVWAK